MVLNFLTCCETPLPASRREAPVTHVVPHDVRILVDSRQVGQEWAPPIALLLNWTPQG
jgi:hypothetical protein